ncbi:hypothetical protein ACKWTF_009495 [Chironomus riparius]
MGSDSSKASKNNANVGSSRSSQYSLNRDQLTHPSTQVKPQLPQLPPPVYTKTDPLQASYNVNLLNKTSQNIQQTTAIASKTGSQISTERNSDLKNKQTSASESGNVANINKPANQQQTTSDHQKLQNINKSKVASTGQSPIYDPTANRFVWTNDSGKSTIDFEQESQKVKKDVLSGNDAASAISKALNKNVSLSEVRKLLINNEYMSDVKFILNSIVFHGHKLFLVTASPLFYQHFQVSGLKEMKVEGIEESIFLAMLSFCYTGILHKLTDDNILSTLLAADKLKISQAYTTCCGFITNKINPDGVFVVFEKAIDLENEQFQKKCLDYIKKNETKCFSSKGFFNIGLASLVTMLEMCDYPTEKLNEVVEKWNHGPAIEEVKPSNIPAGPQNKGAKKKGNPPQQVQKNQQQQQPNAQQQRKPKNQHQQQQQRGQHNTQQQRNQPPLLPFPQQNIMNFPHQQFQHQNSLQFQLQNMQHLQNQNMHHVQQQIIQQRNLQQQPAKNSKQNDAQKSKNRQQQNKKPGPGNQQIPNLIDLDIPPPPFAEGFHRNLTVFPSSGSFMRRADSISNLSDDLMSFKGDDDDTNDAGLVCVDDDEGGKIKIVIKGIESVGTTEFARIDFVAKRSFLLHEVWFNENMIQNSNEIRISIAVFENEQRSDIHSRSIKGVSINRCNFIKFTRQPLKIFVGQKFFIKVNFSEQASRKHLDPQNLSSTDFLELRRDDEVRKYFNCINKLVVSEMA